MNQPPTTNLQTSYDAVAEEYAVRMFDELRHKPLDCQLLDRFAAELREAGWVGDVGCGPGHVARYLAERGVQVVGIDLSPGMIEQAQRLNPGIPFRQGDLRALPVADAAWAGLVAFYSILHLPRTAVTTALLEFHRVLQPGGSLLLAFHVGAEIRHVEELWGQSVSLDFVFFQPEEVTGYLRAAGFQVEEVLERPPYLDVEVQTQRAYLFARKPEA